VLSKGIFAMLPRIEHIKYSVYLIVVRILKGPGSGGACL
jgi:hypothetical protein